MSSQIIEQKFLEYLRSDVDKSVSIGLPDHLSKLDDPSLEAHEHNIKKTRTLIEEIKQIETGQDFYSQLDKELTLRYLEQNLFFDTLEIDGLPARVRAPSGVDGVSEGIFQIFINDEREPEIRLTDIMSRLALIPEYLAKEAEVIQEPIARWRDIEVTQAQGLPELFENILNWAKQINFGDAQKFEHHVEKAGTALESYIESLQSKPTSTSFSIGREKLEELLAVKAIEKTPEQLQQMATDYYHETQETIAAIKGRLIKKYELPTETTTEELHTFLNKKFQVKLKNGKLESVLDYYKEHEQQVLDFIQQQDLFPIPDQQDMLISKTPNFLEPVIPAGAMWPPIPLREGSKRSLVYLTLKEELLDEHTDLGIPAMMIHEGIPGHHLQFASAALQPSLIRKIFNANEHAEGWTTMLEDYMLDIGYIEKDIVDEVRFVTKRDISRLIARVGIDLYFTSGDKKFLSVGPDLEFDSEDPFVNAAKLLKEATGFTDGRVQAELNWYSKEQGYPLSYLTGNRLVWELKRDIQQANPQNLSSNNLDQAFHKIYLQSGCMPVTSLRKVFEHEGFL